MKIQHEKDEYDWGIVVNFRKVTEESRRSSQKDETKIIVDLLLHVAADEEDKDDGEKKIPKPCPVNQVGESVIRF